MVSSPSKEDRGDMVDMGNMGGMECREGSRVLEDRGDLVMEDTLCMVDQGREQRVAMGSQVGRGGWPG